MQILVDKYVNRASLVSYWADWSQYILSLVYLRSSKVGAVLFREMHYTCTDLVVKEFHCQSVCVVDRWVVWLESDVQVLGLPCGDSTPCCRHTEHTQPTVVLGSWYQTRGMLGKCMYMTNILYAWLD